MTRDYKSALKDVNRWAKHIVRGGVETVDVMQLEPSSLEAIKEALKIADRLQIGVVSSEMLKEAKCGWHYSEVFIAMAQQLIKEVKND